MESSSAADWWASRDNIEAIKDYAIQQGLLLKATNDPNNGTVTNVSVTLTPSRFPDELFELACSIAVDINSLVDAISRDTAFLESTLQSVIKSDDFTRRLFELYKEALSANAQTCTLGLTRSDYMVDCPPLGKVNKELQLRQIEINTISSSFFGLTQGKVHKLHEYVQSRYLTKDSAAVLEKIPPNSCLSSVAGGIECAWKEYPKQSDRCFVLFVVQPNERNVYDQRSLEFELWTRYCIPSIRKTLAEISQEAFLGPNKELLLKSGEELAVVYYRSGYSPNDYPTDKEWDARRLMENSRATNCPSVAYQLVGTKKMQQALAKPGAVERFIKDASAAAKIRSTFAGHYSLELGEEGDQNVDMATKEPERFVAKPQREGGGNNFYGEQVKTLLQEIGTTPTREAYILMDMVNPPAQTGFLLRPGATSVKPLPLISELGVFGIFLRKGDQVLKNQEGGYILRTKPVNVNEGGVAMGAGSLDTPSLATMDDFVKSVCET